MFVWRKVTRSTNFLMVDRRHLQIWNISFCFRLPDKGAKQAFCHNYPSVNHAWELRRLRCWSINQSNILKRPSVKRIKFSCMVLAFPLGLEQSQLLVGASQAWNFLHDCPTLVQQCDLCVVLSCPCTTMHNDCVILPHPCTAIHPVCYIAIPLYNTTSVLNCVLPLCNSASSELYCHTSVKQ